jgi:hypothetical protein
VRDEINYRAGWSFDFAQSRELFWQRKLRTANKALADIASLPDQSEVWSHDDLPVRIAREALVAQEQA